MRQVRIVADGGLYGTRVFDEAGVEIPVVEVEFRHGVGDLPYAVVETLAPKIDAVVSATERTRCPYCGHVEEVEDE